MFKLYHHSPECSVFAVAMQDDGCHDIGIDDTIVPVFRDGVACGEIVCRFDEWENELTYIPSEGLPDGIVGFYIGDDYPNSLANAGYTFGN